MVLHFPSGAFCVNFLLMTSIGYPNINSVLSEIRKYCLISNLCHESILINPHLFINISYYAVVSRTDILESLVLRYCFYSQFYRASYFRNLFGPMTESVSFRYYKLYQYILVCWCRTLVRGFIAYLLWTMYYRHQLGSSLFAWLSPCTLDREEILPHAKW